MVRTAVIDNDALVNMCYLHKSTPFFYYLQNLFATVYFPTEVVTEFGREAFREPHRAWVMQRLNPEQGFYRFCSSYDTIVMAMVYGVKGIDKGEAEAYAQLKKVGAHVIISDDKPFARTLKQLDSTIRVYSTVHIICWLDMAGYIPNWKAIIKQLHGLRPFSSKELRQAYLETASMLGLNIHRKTISLKCSLSRIL